MNKCGVEIICKKSILQWMASKNPFCKIDNNKKEDLKWSKSTFIELEPGNHHLLVAFPYPYAKYAFGRKDLVDECCPIEFNVDVPKDKVLKYKYSLPFAITSKGIIKRLKK